MLDSIVITIFYSMQVTIRRVVGTVCQPICHWSCQWRRTFHSFCVYIFALCTVVNIFTVFRMCTLVLCAKFAHFAPCKAKPLIISKEDVDIYIYLSLSLAFCSFGFLSCQSLHSLQSEYIGAVYKICTFCCVQGALCKANVQGTLCKAHCACKAMPLIIWKGRDCTALAPGPDWPTSISGMHKWLTGGWFAFGLLPCTGGQVTVGN